MGSPTLHFEPFPEDPSLLSPAASSFPAAVPSLAYRHFPSSCSSSRRSSPCSSSFSVCAHPSWAKCLQWFTRGQRPGLRCLRSGSVSHFSVLSFLLLFFCLRLSQSPGGLSIGPAEGASKSFRPNPLWFSFDDTRPFSSQSPPLHFLSSTTLSKLSPSNSLSNCAFTFPYLPQNASLSFSFPALPSFVSPPQCVRRSAEMLWTARLWASVPPHLEGETAGRERNPGPLHGAACSIPLSSFSPASPPLSFCCPSHSISRFARLPCPMAAPSPLLVFSAPKRSALNPTDALGSTLRNRGTSNSGDNDEHRLAPSRSSSPSSPSSSSSPSSPSSSPSSPSSSSSSSSSSASEPRRVLSSILLSNLKAKQKRLREAREAEEKERALHAEEEKKKEERARRRKAREALLVNKKKQRKETHKQRVLRSAARRQYLREKRERLDRMFLEDTQTQRSSEKGRLGRGFATEGRRAKKAREIQVLQDLLESSVMVIQLEAHGLTPNQRWSIVRGLALAGFYKGYRIKHGKNSYMRVALRRILERRQREEQEARAKPPKPATELCAPGGTAPQGNSLPGTPGRLESPTVSPSPASTPSSLSASGVASGSSWRPVARRVRRDFWITHNEELAFKAALHQVDISGNKVKRALEPEEEETYQALEADEKFRERRVAERLEANLRSAVWRDDPRFSHLAIGMTRGGVWTQWEDDEELDEEKTEEIPEEVKEAGMPYMDVDDWTDLFEEEIRCMRKAKEEARAREQEILNTLPLEGEVTAVAENGEALMKHLGKTNLYLFVRAMPKNEKRLPLLVKTLTMLLEEIVFDNRVKKEQKGPPPRKYKGQWYDEELLPHISPEIAASMGFEPPAKDGKPGPSKNAGARGGASPAEVGREAVGGEIKVAFLGRSVLTPDQLNEFARRAPTRENLMQKLGGSLIGVTQRLAWSLQAVPTFLASAVHNVAEQKTSSADEKTIETG